MTTRTALGAILLFAAAATLAAAACGRNGLDLGPDTADAATDGGSDAGADRGPAVACGTSSCPLPAQFCCVGTGTQAAAHQCLAASSACAGAHVSCRDDSVCAAGEACCLSPNATGTVCVPRGQCFTSSANVRFCASAVDCLPAAPVCCPLQISPTGFCAPASLGCMAASGAPPP